MTTAQEYFDTNCPEISDDPTPYDEMYPNWRETERENWRLRALRKARITAGLKALAERGVIRQGAFWNPRELKVAYADEPTAVRVQMSGIEHIMDAYDIDPNVDMESLVASYREWVPAKDNFSAEIPDATDALPY